MADGMACILDERMKSALRPRLPFIWDNHTCLPLEFDIAHMSKLERLQAAGVRVVSVNAGYANQEAAEQLALLSAFRAKVTSRADRFVLIENVSDIENCIVTGRLGVVFDVEGMDPVASNPTLVESYYNLGVRWMLIAYNRNNAAGGGCMDQDTGLTACGRKIIDEMARVGMVLCLCHAGERTVRDALDYVTTPPIFSHCNSARLSPHIRNVSDEVMLLCAAKGGVVGLSGIGPFLGASRDLVGVLLNQLRYVIDLVGPEHVGLGLDYVFDTAELEAHVRANPADYPEGVNGGLAMVEPEAMADIADGLARDNLGDHEIHLVLGGNWLRIAQQVWK